MAELETDIVTQIQEKLDQLSVSLFSTIGALQRDAQPSSVRGEPAPATSSKGNSQQMAPQWAAEVMSLSKEVDALIQKLPDVQSTEHQELERVAEAMRANDAAGEELRVETVAVEELLRNVRGMHAALADAELARRTSKGTQPGFLPEQ